MKKEYVNKEGFRVELVSEQVVTIFPSGGGFQRTMPLEQFLQDFVEAPPPTKRPALFSFDDGPEFLGFHDGSRWNGWACPYFTHEVVVQIAQMTNKDPNYQLEYDGASDTWAWVTEDDGEDGPWTFERQDITVDGKEISVFAVGAYGWCWNVTELVKEN